MLIVLSRTHPEYALVVAANRDELLDRPAQPMAVLREDSPRILGGRDLLAGGTWLAVNEHGLVAGLTNRPARAGKDPTRRSRGELPLAIASHASAALAVAAFVDAFRPADYNPAWMLVGDREALFFIDMTGEDGAAVIQPLPPGMHILENRTIGAPSAKVDHVRTLLTGAEDLRGEALPALLKAVLANHDLPAASELGPASEQADHSPAAVTAACVHADSYGTRWSGIISVDTSDRVLPRVLYTDGPPCTTGFVDATPLWSRAGLGEPGRAVARRGGRGPLLA